MALVASVLGALAGIATGLIPGIHVNTVTALLLAASASCASLGIEYSALLAFTCSLAISHTFFDVVPGLFLGIPGDETFALLPGHRLVKQGEGQTAVRLSVVGSGIGLVLGLGIFLAAPLAELIGDIEGAIRPWMFFVLAAISLILVVTDRRRGWSLFTFLASGVLGVAVFGSPLVAGGSDAPVNALFPGLAGLFGVAGLLFAIGTATGGADIPPSTKGTSTLGGSRIAGPGVRGGAAGLLVGLLPGLGAANAATLLLLMEQWRARLFGRTRVEQRGDAEDRAYLVTTSSLNTSEALFAIAALYVIGRSRSGASIAVEQILGGSVIRGDLTSIALSMAVAGAIASAIMWRVAPRLSSAFRAVHHISLNWSVIAFLTALTFFLLGLGGLTILVAATAVGVVPLLFGVRRAQLMGFFLVPAMLFYSEHQLLVVDWLSIGQRTAPMLPSITLPGILLAVGVAACAAFGVYAVARAASRRYRNTGSPARAASLGVAGLLVAASPLIVALFGRAYPEAIEASRIFAAPTAAEGRILRVIDGDTFDIASVCRRFRVRLKGIDAPEIRTAGGRAAREWAARQFSAHRITWYPLGVDAYGRLVGEIYLDDGTFVNEEIVRRGYAEANRENPSEHHARFLSLEGEARAAGLGAWNPSLAAPPAAPSPTVPPMPPEVARWDDNGNGRITCAEARRHGIVPVRRGHPAYPYMRDANDDGIVCN